MANKDILQYLRKTPHNTNVNVVKGMIGNESGSGAIEMETVFDEDISLTYNGVGYSTVTASYTNNNNGIPSYNGYLKASLDDIIIPGISSSMGFNTSNSFNLGNGSNQYYIRIDNLCETGGAYNHFTVEISIFMDTDDPDLQAYCQTPHHLKIELFNL